MHAIEIEVDTPTNDNLHFRPLQRSIRGRFDLMRMGEPMARVRAQEWPPIPSQRLGINPDGVGYVIEPLHGERYAPVRQKIEKAGMTLEPAMTEFEHIHLPSWLFWIKAAVESGTATVTKGNLPDRIVGEPRMNFILAERPPTETDKFAAMLRDQTVAFNRLTDAILKLVEAK